MTGRPFDRRSSGYGSVTGVGSGTNRRDSFTFGTVGTGDTSAGRYDRGQYTTPDIALLVGLMNPALGLTLGLNPLSPSVTLATSRNINSGDRSFELGLAANGGRWGGIYAGEFIEGEPINHDSNNSQSQGSSQGELGTGNISPIINGVAADLHDSYSEDLRNIENGIGVVLGLAGALTLGVITAPLRFLNWYAGQGALASEINGPCLDGQ